MSWDEPFNGRTWSDMPGGNPDDKKMNFALFRRGQLKLVDVEKWEEGDEPGKGTHRKFAINAQSMAGRAAMREAAEARRLEAIKIPGAHAPLPPAAGPEPAEAVSHPEPTPEPEPSSPPPTMNDKQQISPQQAEIRDQFKNLNVYGFAKNLCRQAKCSTATLHQLRHDQVIGSETLDRIKAALDDTSWQGVAAASSKPARTAKAKAPRQPRETAATPQRTPAKTAAGKITTQDLKQAIDDLEAAELHFAQISAAYLQQRQAA